MATIKHDKQYGPTVYGKIVLRVPTYDMDRVADRIEDLLVNAGYKTQDRLRVAIRLSKCQIESNKTRVVERSKWHIRAEWVMPKNSPYEYPRLHLMLLSARVILSKNQRVEVRFTLHTDQVIHRTANHYSKKHPTFREALRIEAVTSSKSEQ